MTTVALVASNAPNATLGALDAPNAALGALDAPNATLGALDAPNAALGALDAPNATLGALDAPNATLGRSGRAELGRLRTGCSKAVASCLKARAVFSSQRRKSSRGARMQGVDPSVPPS